MDPSWLFLVLTSVMLTTIVCNGEQNEYDTIVVGLGAAGTVAASTLARAGKRVLALEAQDRVGGRVYTLPFGDGIVEVGAEWIHGTEDSRTYQTAINNNVTLLTQELETNIVLSDGSQASAVINEIVDKGLEFSEPEGADKTEPLGDYVTKKLMDYMKEKTPDFVEDKDLVTQILMLLSLMAESYEGASDWNDVDTADTYETLGGHQHTSWHRNGYKTFFEIMLNKHKGGEGLPSLKIKLNTEVTKIEWPHEVKSKVSVTTKDGTIYKADNVIVTVSLGVLKERYGTLFTTALPQEKITAIEKLQMGTIGKIILSFPNAWWLSQNAKYGTWQFLWRGEDLNKISTEDKWLTKVVGITPPMGSSNTITLWTCGDAAKQVETMPEEVVKAKALGLLRQFVGANITVPEPTGIVRTKWFSNEFTRGTYTYASVKSADYPTARSDLAAPLNDASGNPRVLFAGEASHPTRFSTVHGAADSGHREAMRILGTLS